MVNSIKDTVWVGISDLDQEGVWKFVTDKTVFDPNKGNTLYRWGCGEPNNHSGSQHCGCIWYRSISYGDGCFMDDSFCWKVKRGLCEIKNY